MSNTQHTSAPWMTHKTSDGSQQVWSFQQENGRLPNNKLVAICPIEHPNSAASNLADSIANAEHIVRCVNSHQALIDALECAAETLRAVSPKLSGGSKEMTEMQERALRAALKAAGAL